ncbi:MAG: hypothetical protein ACOC95_07800 [Planctomycetota bacterium]
MKRLFIALMILEGVLLVVLALPVLHESDSYDEAAAAWREQRTEETLEAFQREQAKRDRQVIIAFIAVAGLCANSLGLCYVFGRLAEDPSAPRRGPGVLSPRRRWMKRLAQLALLVAVAMMGGGGITFARGLNTPARTALHGLIIVLFGGMLAFGAVLAWMITATPDQALPVEQEERTDDAED